MAKEAQSKGKGKEKGFGQSAHRQNEAAERAYYREFRQARQETGDDVRVSRSTHRRNVRRLNKHERAEAKARAAATLEASSVTCRGFPLLHAALEGHLYKEPPGPCRWDSDSLPGLGRERERERQRETHRYINIYIYMYIYRHIFICLFV